MGKSGNKKKKPVASGASDAPVEAPHKMETVALRNSDCGQATNVGAGVASASVVSSGNPSLPRVEQFAAAFLRRAHELKEEGNCRFQSKDYQAALTLYEQALKLTPRNHPDRAVFHSNRAACLMQMKPVQYEAVIRECTLALEIHPKFSRALFRRARALEALGKLELALHDVQTILQEEANHQDALELAKRLRVCIGSREEAQRDMQGRASSAGTLYAGTSPAALGASVVRGSPSPVANRGPTLPARPLPKRKGMKPEQATPTLKPPNLEAKQDGVGILTKGTKGTRSQPESRDNPMEASSQTGTSKPNTGGAPKGLEPRRVPSQDKVSQRTTTKVHKQGSSQSRPLKLVYGHDIRLACMPTKCRFRDLREIVEKRFPSAKAVLVKYKDLDGDLITITSTEELRLAEMAADAALMSAKDMPFKEEQGRNADTCVPELPLLRLHVVEVSSEQEPVLEEDEGCECLDSLDLEDVDDKAEGLSETVKEDEPQTDSLALAQNTSLDASKRKGGKSETDEEGKEIEIDEWLLDFAHLFRTHIGVDPDAHIDLHELGMEFCSEALEETVTCEAAQPLFDAATCKFQEVAALAFFNWGNVHMCAARKRIPLEEGTDKDMFSERLHAAFNWAQSQYELAAAKYEQALCVKPDFYEGVLALGQESFESAKLRWSLAAASKADLKTWDSSETMALFKQAEERMKVAVDLWEKLEERRLNELSCSAPAPKRDGLKAEARSSRENSQELSEAETREQLRVMRCQINLFWGNILFEHSQVEYKLGSPSWKPLLDEAVLKFELAGASPSDILVVLKNHAANSACPLELRGSNVIIREQTSESQGTGEEAVVDNVLSAGSSLENSDKKDDGESVSVL